MKPLNSKIFSMLNLHYLVLGLLMAVNLFLCGRFFVEMHTLHNAGPDEIAQERTNYLTAQLQMRPLIGLPHKVDVARQQAGDFYDSRFPAAYSTISAALNELETKNNVRPNGISYTQIPVLPGLAEVRIDARLSGEYPALMHFINGLERSKTFFLIDGLTLTGEQGGLVNLRLSLTTYLHANDLDRLAPPGPAPDEEPAAEENN